MAQNTLVAATTAASAISNLLMVSPQSTVGYQPGAVPLILPDGSPVAQPPANPILFHYEGEQSLDSSCDITDHYIEDNTAIQDQIAIKPIRVTTHGFIGELNDVPPAALAILQAAAQKLTAIGAYAPQLSSTALLAYNEAFFAYQTVTNLALAAVSAWSSVGNQLDGSNGQAVIGSSGVPSLVEGANGPALAANQNLQQTYFQQFFYYQQQRSLFTIQTPWCVLESMAIEQLHPVQDAETNVITDFNVTFKQIRTAQTTSLSGLENSPSTTYAGQLNSQAQPLTNVGTSTPVAGTSVDSGLTAMGAQ